jgi:hypothetical protein
VHIKLQKKQMPYRLACWKSKIVATCRRASREIQVGKTQETGNAALGPDARKCRKMKNDLDHMRDK